jgi:hypothetical protein
VREARHLQPKPARSLSVPELLDVMGHLRNAMAYETLSCELSSQCHTASMPAHKACMQVHAGH